MILFWIICPFFQVKCHSIIIFYFWKLITICPIEALINYIYGFFIRAISCANGLLNEPVIIFFTDSHLIPAIAGWGLASIYILARANTDSAYSLPPASTRMYSRV